MRRTELAKLAKDHDRAAELALVKLDAVGTLYERKRQALEADRRELDLLVLEAHRHGFGSVRLARVSGLHRTQVARIVNRHQLPMG